MIYTKPEMKVSVFETVLTDSTNPSAVAYDAQITYQTYIERTVKTNAAKAMELIKYETE